jgi:C-terminal of Roc, COR, domain
VCVCVCVCACVLRVACVVCGLWFVVYCYAIKRVYVCERVHIVLIRTHTHTHTLTHSHNHLSFLSCQTFWDLSLFSLSLSLSCFSLSSISSCFLQWLADACRTVVTFSHKWVRDGVFHLEDVKHMMPSWSSEEREKVLAILEKFHVVSKIPSAVVIQPQHDLGVGAPAHPTSHPFKYLVPSRLPDTEPSDVRVRSATGVQRFCGKFLVDAVQSIRRCALYRRSVRFRFLPHAFFPRVIVRTLHLSAKVGG